MKLMFRIMNLTSFSFYHILVLWIEILFDAWLYSWLFGCEKKWALQFKYAHYHLMNGVLLWRNYDDVLLICLDKGVVDNILIGVHDGRTKHYFGGEWVVHIRYSMWVNIGQHCSKMIMYMQESERFIKCSLREKRNHKYLYIQSLLIVLSRCGVWI